MAFSPRKRQIDCSGGVQARTVEALAVGNQVLHALNAEFTSKLGSVTGRKGSLVLSTVVASQPVLNIMQWLKNDGTKKYFAAVGDGQDSPKLDIFINAAVLAGAWSKSLEDWTNGKDVFYTNFINQIIVCNGTDPVKSWNGSSWAAITNCPDASKFPEVFQSRLFTLTETGYLWKSDVIDSAGTGFTTTAWTSRGINPNDGQKSKMLKRHRNRLVIFKEESIYRYDGSNEPDAIIKVGTHSSKSVVVLGDIYFHHPTAIYRMGVGEPVPISRAVQKYLDGMSTANWENVAGGRDLENLYFWIGNVTINDIFEHDYGKTYTNVVLVYNVYAQTWTVYSGWDARVWFYDETTGLAYFGTSAGKIVQINYDYADVDGTTSLPINFELIFTPEDYGFPDKYKEFPNIEVIGRYNSDILTAGDFDNMTGTEELNQYKSGEKVTCKKLWIGVNESYKDKPPRIEGYILDNVNLLDDAS
jgi:hypothetical protein